MSIDVSKSNFKKEMDIMNGFGTRLTGSKGNNDFIAYLKKEIKKMGFETKSDIKKFKRWEATNTKLVLHTANGDVDVKVASAHPYSGVTGPEGITGKLQTKGVGRDIVVLKMKDFENLTSKIPFDQRRAYPKDLRLNRQYRGPVTTSFVKTVALLIQSFIGCKGAILIWQGMSDEMVEGQYLNFILGYMGVPALWVNETEGEKVLKALKAGDTATLTLEGIIEKKAKGESFCAIVPGKKDKEAIIINTHTDGTNCVEENGAVGMLEMMRYFKKHKPERTLIFVFTTGHFRIPDFSHKHGIVDQSTSLWLHNNKALWDGKGKHIKVVAGVTVEHLGCTEWKDVNGVYQQTNPVDVEVVYTGNKVMDDIYFEAIKGRKQCRTVTLHPHNLLHFGEGQSLFNVGIPDIALVTAPDYLCVVSDNHEMDKFNLDLAVEQTETFIKVIELINKKKTKELGKVDGYNFGLGRA